MKKIIGIILLVGFLIQMGSQVFIIANYFANKAYFANTLCVNKATPKKGCEGKCQLAKKLDDDNATKRSQVPNIEEKQGSPFILNSIEIKLSNLLSSDFVFVLNESVKISSGAKFSILQPPELV